MQTAEVVVGLEVEEVAAIVTGRTESISIEQTVRCLDRFDDSVDLIIRRKKTRASGAAAA